MITTSLKKFALLKLFPAWTMEGILPCSGNQVLADVEAVDEKDALRHFQTERPDLKLNNNGYAKDGEITYTIAEYFNY